MVSNVLNIILKEALLLNFIVKEEIKEVKEEKIVEQQVEMGKMEEDYQWQAMKMNSLL